MEMIFGGGIGVTAAILVLAVELGLRRLFPKADRDMPLGQRASANGPATPDSASSTDWIRNTIGAPPVESTPRAAASRSRPRCPSCSAWIAKGAEFCRRCGALVSA
jgi:hypothetical protein